MNQKLSDFAARLRASIFSGFQNENFNTLALELFALQFQNNSVYRKICEARKLTPSIVEHWRQFPFAPTNAFKELEMTSLAPDERTVVFHSSGTTEQKPGKHFHCAESLEIYETSLWSWFNQSVFDNSKSKTQNLKLICLTPPLKLAPHSSLVHMLETIEKKIGGTSVSAGQNFFGTISSSGNWILDFEPLLAALNSSFVTYHSSVISGTAFSFVHLLDFLAERNLKIRLPENSVVTETGGYKNHSRTMPKAELHSLIEKFLGIPRENIICEYGMSELSSQAYDGGAALLRGHRRAADRPYRFPPWARAQIVSPETGREVRDGETGLIRIFDLANVFSVAAIQTEDLGIRRGENFELIGRAQFSEPRGCSLMTT